MDLQSPVNLPTQPAPASPPVPPINSPVPPPIQAMPSAPAAMPSAAADDMFSGVDKVPAPSPMSAPQPMSAPVPPIVASQAPMPATPAAPSPMAPQRVLSPLPEPHHPPVLHYVLIALAVVAVLGVIAGGVWFFAIRRPAQQVMEALPVAPVATSTNDAMTPSSAAPMVPADEPVGGTTEFGEPEEIPSKPVVTPPEGATVPLPSSIDPNGVGLGAPTSATADQGTPQPAPVQPAQPVDQDADGLSDAREIELGTNPALADTDSDGLTDGDEVLKHRTNPLVPDTDGDAYPDGVEVQKGFNPLGPGKCANPSCTL